MMHKTIQFSLTQCSFAHLLVAKSELGICSIFIGDDEQEMLSYLHEKFSQHQLVRSNNENWIEQVRQYIEQPSTSLTIPLDIKGTVFQKKVWQALQTIPSGKTVSYTDIANQIGLPLSTRAVAQACGANLLAVVIPCHRVIRKDGMISGYRWGVDKKRILLDREGLSI